MRWIYTKICSAYFQPFCDGLKDGGKIFFFFFQQILGKLTALSIIEHEINKLTSDLGTVGYLPQKLEKLAVANGNLTEINIEFLQVWFFVVYTINTILKTF